MLFIETTAAKRAAWESVLARCNEHVEPGRAVVVGPAWARARASHIAPHLAYPERVLAYRYLPNGQSMLSAMPPKLCHPMRERAGTHMLSQLYAMACQDFVDGVVGIAALYAVAVALRHGKRAAAWDIAMTHDRHIVGAVLWGVVAGGLCVAVLVL